MTAQQIRVGTRASELAMAQAGTIADQLAAASGVTVELVPITSDGDRRTESLSTLGGTGIFANALRVAMLDDRCDVLVHSLKDLPTVPYEGLRLGAIPKREDARDTLCARDGHTLANLPESSRVGTGSPRRIAQLKAARPDLEVVDIRGNVGTRLGRVESGDLDAVVLAAAGLTRLGRLDVVTEFLELGRWPTAPGQGALGVEVREDAAPKLVGILDRLTHATTQLAAVAERSVLAHLDAGCSAPLGASGIVDGGLLLLTATVYAADGSSQLTSSRAVVLEEGRAARLQQAEELGAEVGDELLAQGAAGLVPA